MVQEQMALYKTHGTNPFAACLPLLIQVPFFFALFTVLSGMTTAASSGKGIGAMSHEQVVQFDESSIFGVPLSASLLHGTGGNVVTAWILAIGMILTMTTAQFVTQKHIMARTVSAEAMAGPSVRQQKIMLYALPIVFGAGGIFFPLGVLVYWTTTKLWTMVQQFILDPRSP